MSKFLFVLSLLVASPVLAHQLESFALASHCGCDDCDRGKDQPCGCDCGC